LYHLSSYQLIQTSPATRDVPSGRVVGLAAPVCDAVIKTLGERDANVEPEYADVTVILFAAAPVIPLLAVITPLNVFAPAKV
jgi:hypothetical protein